MIRAIFVRHGQSTANAGEPTEDFATIPLTELGWEQARALADTFTAAPGKIVVSPYLRAEQTATATIKRFREVPVETWPIYEFTFWDPAYVRGVRAEELMREIDSYWRVADPERRFGSGAESFAMFLGRAEETFRRLGTEESASPTVLFTHGHFIQALRLTVLYPEWSARRKMQEFRAFDEAQWVQNTQRVTADFDGLLWEID